LAKSALDQLSPKHRIFAVEYAADSNVKRAAIEAGYNPHSAAITGQKLLKKKEVRAAVDELLRPVLKEGKLTVERLAKQLANYVYRSIKDFVGVDGWLIHDPSSLPDEVAQCVEGWEAEYIYNDEGVITGQRVKVKLVSKAKMQDLAMRHVGMLQDVHLHQHNEQTNVWQQFVQSAGAERQDAVEAKIKGVSHPVGATCPHCGKAL
jgi:hypothetical protein